MEKFISNKDFAKHLIRNKSVRKIFDVLFPELTGCFKASHEIEYCTYAEDIFAIVEKFGEGFVVDICHRVNESLTGRTIELSEKQRWCIAFAFLKITEEQVDEYFAELSAQIEEDDAAAAANETVAEEADEQEEAIVEAEVAAAADQQGDTLSAADIRLVDEYQESGRVFIHTYAGQTIQRIMARDEIRDLQKIRRNQSMAEFKEAVASLFNRKYRKSHTIRKVEPSRDDERYFERVALVRLTGTTI